MIVALQRLLLKVVDSIQEFILRRLLGELQEVNNKTNQYIRIQLTKLSPVALPPLPVFIFFVQLFDIERAELYLSVLQQLEVVYASAAQHRRSILHTCLPKLINHSLKVLQEPSQQVRRKSTQNSRRRAGIS